MLYSSLQSTDNRAKAMATLVVDCDFWPILLMVEWNISSFLTIHNIALSSGLHYTVHALYLNIFIIC